MRDQDLAKIKLIYEFNNNSPLFARVAEAYLKEEKVNTAVEILNRGLQLFPNYTSAQLVLFEAYAKQGEYKEVISGIDELRDELDEETVNYYLDKTEEEREKKEETEISDDDNSDLTDDDLDILAERLNNAKMPKADEDNMQLDHSAPEETKNKLVSETLAEIYLMQGNYTEALNIYETLLENNPSKKEHFQQKISETKNKMN